MSVPLMYLLYSLLLTVGFLAMLPWFAIDAFRTRKYITGLSQRLGRLPAIALDPRPLIWLHCVSVGETEAARPLVRALLDKFPSYRLVVSTTTVTGLRAAGLIVTMPRPGTMRARRASPEIVRAR